MNSLNKKEKAYSKEKCLISVIVPIYNTPETHFRECVQSVISQNFDNWELILVDDGSNLSTAKLCDILANEDERILVHHKPNGGVTSARRYGIERAKSEWIYLLDSDDKLYPKGLSNLYTYHLEADMICGRFDDSNGQSFPTLHNGIIDKSQYIQLFLQRKVPMSLAATLFKKCLFTSKVLNLPSQFIYGEDYLSKIILSQACTNVFLCNDIIFTYVNNVQSVTHTVVQSPLYRVAFLKERNKYLSLDLIQDRLQSDYEELLSSVFDKRLPYKNSYREAVLSYFSDKIQATTTIPRQLKRKYWILKNIPILLYIYKLMLYPTICLLCIVLNKKRKLIDITK